MARTNEPRERRRERKVHARENEAQEERERERAREIWRIEEERPVRESGIVRSKWFARCAMT